MSACLTPEESRRPQTKVQSNGSALEATVRVSWIEIVLESKASCEVSRCCICSPNQGPEREGVRRPAPAPLGSGTGLQAAGNVRGDARLATLTFQLDVTGCNPSQGLERPGDGWLAAGLRRAVS
jgi:hypothetical protein